MEGMVFQRERSGFLRMNRSSLALGKVILAGRKEPGRKLVAGRLMIVTWTQELGRVFT